MSSETSLELLPKNQELELPGKTAYDELKDLEALKHGTEDVSEAILGERVKINLVSQEIGLQFPNYTLDLSKAENEILDISMLALKSLMREDGTSSFYLLVKNGVAILGKCFGEDIIRILSPSLKYIFGGQGTLIKNFGSAEAVRIVSRDASEFRLDL